MLSGALLHWVVVCTAMCSYCLAGEMGAIDGGLMQLRGPWRLEVGATTVNVTYSSVTADIDMN